MTKTEQKACLSTSNPQVPTPPSSPEPELQADRRDKTPPPVPPKHDSAGPRQQPPEPDYILVLCYILVYLEIAWLIIMVLRSYSRD